MEQFILLFTNQFFQTILMVAVLGSLLASIASFIMGYNNFGGIAGSLAHMILGGVGIAGFFGFSPFLGSIVVVILASIILTSIKLKAPHHLEIIGNILWGTGMAIGVLFISMMPGYQQNLNNFLFGNILLVSSEDIIQSLWLNGVSILFIIIFFRQLLLLMFNPDLAKAQNLPIFFLYFILIMIISFSIINLVKTVGIVLALVLLSVPFYTIRLISNRIIVVLFGSFLLSFLSIVLGLFFSYTYSIPNSSAIVMVSIAIFLILKLTKRVFFHR